MFKGPWALGPNQQPQPRGGAEGRGGYCRLCCLVLIFWFLECDLKISLGNMKCQSDSRPLPSPHLCLHVLIPHRHIKLLFSLQVSTEINQEMSSEWKPIYLLKLFLFLPYIPAPSPGTRVCEQHFWCAVMEVRTPDPFGFLTINKFNQRKYFKRGEEK